ncbi:MAG: hypothetical protein JNM78_10815 [Cyclobacteriaceae bacterium]|nr:hypothetical protein [Cyclobacteriaceae bacterium]
MDTSPVAQRKRRFWLYIVFTLFCIAVSFWSGFRLGREVEKQEWLELGNPPIEKAQQSS